MTFHLLKTNLERRHGSFEVFVCLKVQTDATSAKIKPLTYMELNEMGNQIKIGIIGAGAMGLLYAANLAEKADLTLFTRREEQANALKQKGISLIDNGTTKTIHINAVVVTDTAALSKQQLLIVAVKQYSLLEILPLLQAVPVETPMLFIQNGAGHLENLPLLGEKRTILVGISEHGAGRENDTTVVWRGHGRTKYSVYQGELDVSLEDWLNSVPDFPVEQHVNYLEIIQEKLFINAVINPLTAVLGVRNGELLENPEWHKLLGLLVEEMETVLPVQNGALKVKEICRVTANNFSSMALDKKHGRKTEIDGIVLPILEKAEREGKTLPTLRTLYHIIKGLEGDSNV